MAGTIMGGKHAAETNRKLYGDDFYSRIGKIGGKKGRTGGFAAATPEERSEWGRKGGKKSKRGSGKKLRPTWIPVDYQPSLTFPNVEVEPIGRMGWLERLRRKYEKLHVKQSR